jgi:hypothetical protein
VKPDVELKRLLRRREMLAAELAAVDRKITVASESFSRDRGYMFSLRPEQIRRELERA